jgi:single-strand DNA-binding protein
MLNKVTLIGNLGCEVDLRFMPNGTAVATFTMATSESYKDKQSGERKTITEWHNIKFFRGSAEAAAKFLKKGSKVCFEGKITTEKWDDKDNVTHYKTVLVGSNWIPLDKKDPLPTDPNPSSTPQPGVDNYASYDDMDDQIPF